MKLEKWTGLLKKYRLAALVVLLGVGLMLLIICLPPCFWIAALGAAMVAAGVIMVVGKK